MTSRNIIIGILIAVIIWMAMCRNKPQPVIPDVTDVQTIRDTIRINEANADAIIQPYVELIKQKDNQLSILELSYEDEQVRTGYLQDENDRLLAKLKAGELTDSITTQAAKLKENQRKKDSICSARVAVLITQRTAQQKILSTEKDKYANLKRQMDTCLKNQSTLTDYAQNSRIRNKLAVGIVSNVYPVLGIGAGADFIHKKGWVFSASGTYMPTQRTDSLIGLRRNNELYVQIGVKKVISLRK